MARRATPETRGAGPQGNTLILYVSEDDLEPGDLLREETARALAIVTLLSLS